MHQVSYWIFATAAFCFTFKANAESSYDISMDSGRSRFYGDLSDDQSAPTHALSTCFMQQEEHIQWGLGIHVMQVTTNHSGQDFPYDQDSKLTLLSFFFTPVICTRGKIYVCGAIGNGTVNVNAPKHRQDYGSWTYKTGVSVKILDRWALSLASQYVGRIEQQILDRKTEFSFLSVLLGFTFNPSPQSF